MNFLKTCLHPIRIKCQLFNFYKVENMKRPHAFKQYEKYHEKV